MSYKLLHLDGYIVFEEQLELKAKQDSLDFICLNEHLKTCHEISTLNICEYVGLSDFCRSRRLHGGVCIYVSNKISVELLSGFFFNNWRITFWSCRYGIGMFFNNLQILLSSLDYLHSIIITGDFNVKFNCKNNVLCDICASSGLYHNVEVMTRQNAWLHTIFTNISIASVAVDTYFSDQLRTG